MSVEYYIIVIYIWLCCFFPVYWEFSCWWYSWSP